MIEEFMSAVCGVLHVFEDATGIWFNGAEVCELLQYNAENFNYAHIVNRLVDENDRRQISYKAGYPVYGTSLWKNPSDFRSKILINEFGLYALTMRSKAPKAREFQHWVTHDVLPSIRQNGGYIEGQEKLSKSEQKDIAKQTRVLKDKVAFLQKRRHEILADNRRLKASLIDSENELGMRKQIDREFIDLFDSVMAEYETLYKKDSALRLASLDKKYGPAPEPRKTVVMDSEGFIVEIRNN